MSIVDSLPNKKRKAAFFDIDGTLVNGFIICEFPNYLTSKGYFNKESNSKIQEYLIKYKKGEISDSEASIKIPQEYSKGLKGQKEIKIKKLAKMFMDNYRSNFYTYAKELVKLMKSKGYVTIAISGSPIEAIKELNFFGFDQYYGSETEANNGTYTGKLRKNLVDAKVKEETFSMITKNEKIDLENSIAFGDTEHDSPILSKVKNPFVINAGLGLIKYAKRKGWTICTPDNIIEKIKNLVN